MALGCNEGECNAHGKIEWSVMVSGTFGARPLSVLIAGPTGSGKSALALDLARACNGVIINADAMQVYGELRILTARPGESDEACATHRLYGTISGQETYSTGRWQTDAMAEIVRAHANRQTAIVVGGTGLYFEALVNGLAEIPQIPAEVRAKWRRKLSEQGLESIRPTLESTDEVMAARIVPSDRQRTLRALEVLDATGRSLAWWQANTSGDAQLAGETKRVVVAPPRKLLHQRIEKRAQAMIDQGALDEVGALIKLGLDPDLPVMKAIGVRELARAIDGTSDLETALAAMCTSTRRYAKRQLTWARRRMADWQWVGEGGEALGDARAYLDRAMKG